jgi:exodeoxyribonuclease VII small subunit
VTGEPVNLKSFEASFEELEELVRKLEGGALTLDESLAHYERGVRALKRCYQILEVAEKKLEVLVREGDGALATRPVDLAEVRGEARGGAKVAPAAAPAVATVMPTPHVATPNATSPHVTGSHAATAHVTPTAPSGSGERAAAPKPAKPQPQAREGGSLFDPH